MNESQMTLGMDYHADIDPTGWLISEKMNGCRAYWDGAQFWTRGGNIISAPEWFMDGLPGEPLDGEIWAGRGCFEESRRAVQHGHFTRRCRFVAFDAPAANGTWPRRLASAARFWRDVVSFEVCEDHGWLMEKLQIIQNDDGEGFIIRHPTIDYYETGKTGNMLKVKTLI